MSGRRLVGVVCLVVPALGALDVPAVTQDEWTAADSAWLDEAGEKFHVDEPVPGLSVAIAIGGRQVYARGFGAAGVGGEGAAITADTRFRTASVTKSLTAVAVMRLVEEGRINLDVPARRYCAAYPAKPVDPTVRHLLGHQSGLPHTTDAEDTTITGDYTRLGDAVTLYADKPLAFTPGSRTLYSSWGYALLGCVIEGAAGAPYWDAMTKLVFEPAGVVAPARDTPTFATPPFTPGFRPGGRSGMRPAEVVDTRFKTPASGLIASASDLMRFSLALLDGRLLSASSRAVMFTPDDDGAPAGTQVLGWQVSAPRGSGRAVYHTGSMEGTTALLYIVPDLGNVFVLLVNRERHIQATVGLFQAIAERARRN